MKMVWWKKVKKIYFLTLVIAEHVCKFPARAVFLTVQAAANPAACWRCVASSSSAF